jgi:hypothetical protein
MTFVRRKLTLTPRAIAKRTPLRAAHSIPTVLQRCATSRSEGNSLPNFQAAEESPYFDFTASLTSGIQSSTIVFLGWAAICKYAPSP